MRNIYVLMNRGYIVGYFASETSAMQAGMDSAHEEYGDKYVQEWKAIRPSAQPGPWDTACQRFNVSDPKSFNGVQSDAPMSVWWLHVGLPNVTHGYLYVAEFHIHD